LLKFSTGVAALQGKRPSEVPSSKNIINISAPSRLARSLLLCSINLAAAGRTNLRTDLGDRHNRESRYGLCEARRRRQRHDRNWPQQTQAISGRPRNSRCTRRFDTGGGNQSRHHRRGADQPTVGRRADLSRRLDSHRAARSRFGHRGIRPGAAALDRTRRHRAEHAREFRLDIPRQSYRQHCLWWPAGDRADQFRHIGAGRRCRQDHRHRAGQDHRLRRRSGLPA